MQTSWGNVPDNLPVEPETIRLDDERVAKERRRLLEALADIIFDSYVAHVRKLNKRV